MDFSNALHVPLIRRYFCKRFVLRSIIRSFSLQISSAEFSAELTPSVSIEAMASKAFDFSIQMYIFFLDFFHSCFRRKHTKNLPAAGPSQLLLLSADRAVYGELQWRPRLASNCFQIHRFDNDEYYIEIIKLEFDDSKNFQV